jgi:hypothetical protein
VKAAIQQDKLLRLRNMQSPANKPEEVEVFYGESWAVVKYMVDTYGKDKFAAIFKSVKDGSPMDDALQQNIGVDQDGLYNAWRKSVGLKTIDFPPVPKASAAGAQATQPPLGIPTSVTSADSTSGAAGGDATAVAGVSKTTAIAVGAGAILVAAVLGFVALRMMRKPAA